jgi:pilus assembly protein Flp/PilA
MELLRHIKAFIRNEDGIAAIEYGILAGVIAVGIVSGAGELKNAINAMFTTVSGNL